MSVENQINAVKKLITNIVLKDVPFNYDLSVRHNEEYNKIVIDLGVSVDAAKINKSTPTYNKKYVEIIENIKEVIDKSIKWLGLSWENTTIFITFSYFNIQFLEQQKENFYNYLVKKLKSNNWDDDSISSINLWVDIRYGEEETPYVELEVGYSGDDEFVYWMRSVVEDALADDFDDFPALHYLWVDDWISFWDTE